MVATRPPLPHHPPATQVTQLDILPTVYISSSKRRPFLSILFYYCSQFRVSLTLCLQCSMTVCLLKDEVCVCARVEIMNRRGGAGNGQLVSPFPFDLVFLFLCNQSYTSSTPDCHFRKPDVSRRVRVSERWQPSYLYEMVAAILSVSQVSNQKALDLEVL